jgi:L-lactate dehydrogenase complex protein LldG
MSASARTNILNKIKKALEQPTPLPFPESVGVENPYQPAQQELALEFAEQFTNLQGKFILSANRNELAEQFYTLCHQNQWTMVYCAEDDIKQQLQQWQWFEDISRCEVAVTSCETLVARTGSMVLSSTANGRVPSVYAPIHICIAYTSQLVYDLSEAIQGLEKKYTTSFPSMFSLATGPSRTADIEKTLVVGVHGPKEVYCFLVEDLAPAS